MKKQIAAALAAMFVMSTAATVMAAPIDLTGNVRYKFDNLQTEGFEETNDNTTKLRYRLGASATVNENWKVQALFEATEDMRTSGAANGLAVNRAYLDGKIGDVGMNIGRVYILPAHGMVVDTYIDGVKASMGAGDLKANLYYGKIDKALGAIDPDYTAVELGYAVTEKTGLKLAHHVVADRAYIGDDFNSTEFGFDSKLTDDLTLVGTFATSNAVAYETGMELGVKFKGADKKEAGSFGTWAFYRNLEPFAMYKPTYDYANVKVIGIDTGFKGFEVGFNYTVDKNMVWTTAYSTGESAVDGVDEDGKYFKTQLEVFF
jgi:hypothetical protein